MLDPSSARVRRDVLDWYAAQQRPLPWRGLTDPYAVLVSEVMLQQTQASRAAERFPRFMSRFPAAATLAAASPASVLSEWTGLGYNRRALALRAAAATVAHDGWPRDVAGLERLPGVGPYTARAIASLAFGLPVGVVDTNVRRWLLRRFGGPDSPRRLQQLADELAAPGRGDDIAAWTHASIELGATLCRSRMPICEMCPLAGDCPSAGAAQPVPVRRQAQLRGSDRAYRGAAVRVLSRAGSHATTETALRAALIDAGPALDDAAWRRILGGLERDGLAHRSGGKVRLGAATIGA